MQTEYFIVVDGHQEGPFALEDLRFKHLSPDTLVWRTGMPEWVEASLLEEVAPFITVDGEAQEAIKEDEPREEAVWFAMINRVRIGPSTLSDLINRGLDMNTPVWYPGLHDWTLASQVEEVRKRLVGATAESFANNPQYGDAGRRSYNDFSRPPYGADFGFQNQSRPKNPYENPGNSYPQSPTNWMPWAIVATIAGFFFSCIGCIFGIIGIVYANKSNTFRAQGFDNEADQANNTAKTMTIIGLVIAGIGLLATGYVFQNPGLFMGGLGNF